MSKNDLFVSARCTKAAALGETPGVHTGAIGAFGSWVAVLVSAPMPARADAHCVSRLALTPLVLLDPPRRAAATFMFARLTKTTPNA